LGEQAVPNSVWAGCARRLDIRVRPGDGLDAEPGMLLSPILARRLSSTCRNDE
jgi:hypothetical protein